MRDRLVAVYGSLKKGFGNHRLLEKADFVGTDRISGWVMYHLGGFPGIIAGEGDISIELYKVNRTEFRHLDMLEGYPSFYNRKQVTTNEGEAWIYYLNDENMYSDHPIVENGVW